MNLILLCHPAHLGSESMPRYARMIGDGLKERGHQVSYWTSPMVLGRLSWKPGATRKWLGYIDSYVIFPFLLRWKRRGLPPDSLFIVTDHALGMWVPSIAAKPHVIHCHDFTAQRSALGKIADHATGISGKIYQRLIRRGYRHGRNFISISEKTRSDLAETLIRPANYSEVVYNGLNYPFRPLPIAEVLERLGVLEGPPWEGGYFLHVGSNDWYKNRGGVIELYHQYLAGIKQGIPLIMVGAPPTNSLLLLAKKTPANGRVFFLTNLTNAQVHAAYAAATALIFPSYEEGFGWPIIEAQASGCPVITTGAAPMTEVGGQAAWYLPRRRGGNQAEDAEWVKNGAFLLKRISTLPAEERAGLVAAGLANAGRFTTESALMRLETIYRALLKEDSAK